MRILAVDLSNVFWSNALRGDVEGTAVRDLALDEIRRVARQVGAERVVIACDGKGSFRRSLWPKYKAGRAERPEHLWHLLADTVRHCDANGWHVLRAPETPDGPVEADDVIGAVATWCGAHGHALDILSGDSDLAQLVVNEATRPNFCAGVRLLRRYKGVTPLDAVGVFAWLKIGPLGVVDLKALAGDGGDGYGDVFPGFGESSAIAALAPDEHGNPKRTAREVVDAAFAVAEAWVAGGKVAKDKPKAGVLKLWLEGEGRKRLDVSLRLARVASELPLDLDSLSTARTAKALPTVAANMLPASAVMADPDDEGTWCKRNDECGFADGHPGACNAPTRAVSPAKTLAEPVLDAPGKGQDAGSKQAAAPASAACPPSSTSAGPSAPAAVECSTAGAAADGRGLVRVDTSMRMLVPAAEASARITEFQAMVKAIMVPSVDYGRIPGTPKDTLFQSGAQKLAEVYGLVPRFEFVTQVERWDDPMFFYYKIMCCLLRKGDALEVAQSIGSCNSRETKYGGRWAYDRQVPAHLDRSKLKSRTFKDRKKNDEEVTQWRIPNEELADVVNTIQKMAQKRAFVGAVIMATRSGGTFSQDLEDVPAAAYGEQFSEAQWE